MATLTGHIEVNDSIQRKTLLVLCHDGEV